MLYMSYMSTCTLKVLHSNVAYVATVQYVALKQKNRKWGHKLNITLNLSLNSHSCVHTYMYIYMKYTHIHIRMGTHKDLIIHTCMVHHNYTVTNKSAANGILIPVVMMSIRVLPPMCAIF